mgnify:CR=1 FL=1
MATFISHSAGETIALGERSYPIANGAGLLGQAATYADVPSAATALLVGVDFGLPHFDTELDELAQLATTAGLTPVARLTCKRKAPDAAMFVGTGQAAMQKPPYACLNTCWPMVRRCILTRC